MKKNSLVIISNLKNKVPKNDIDSLARMIASGFEQVYKRFEQVDKRFEQIDKRFEQVDKRFEQIDTTLHSMSQELNNHSVRLERIEKRQVGTLATLDETVHRTEFKALIKRVDVLERKK